MLQIIKIGTQCLYDEKGDIDYELIRRKAHEIEAMKADSVLVVSGAITLGKKIEEERKENRYLKAVELQGYASIGQRILMDIYSTAFTRPVAQILLTEEELKHGTKIRELMHHNAKKRRISAVNYNDCIDFMELRKDNDTLAAILLGYCNAERLIILGKYDGFYRDGAIVEIAKSVNENDYRHCNGTSENGTGGFETKLEAAKIVLEHRKEMIIGNINHSIEDLVAGRVRRTLFKSLH